MAARRRPRPFPNVGRMGLPIFVGLRGMAIPELAGHVKKYREAWREAAIPATATCASGSGVRRPHERPRSTSRGHDHVLLPATGPISPRAARSRRNRPVRAPGDPGPHAVELSYPEILETKVAFGTGPRSWTASRGSVRSSPERRRGRAEPRADACRWSRRAELADSHAAGAARVK